jgi:hypothetical protein
MIPLIHAIGSHSSESVHHKVDSNILRLSRDATLLNPLSTLPILLLVLQWLPPHDAVLLAEYHVRNMRCPTVEGPVFD